MTKICSCCKEEKEIVLFSKDSSKKDGYRAMCKQCWNKKKIYHNAKYADTTKGLNEQELHQYRAFQSMIADVKKALKECEFKLPKWKSKGTYTCCVCKQEKPLSEFYKWKGALSGHDRKCKECSRKQSVLKSRKYRATEQGIQNRKEYMKTEQWKLSSRLGRAKRRAALKDVEQKFSAKDAREVMSKFNYSCFKCGSKDNLHIDHHIPLSKGGRLTFTNAVILCAVCNVKKSNKDPQEFYSQKELIALDKRFGVHRDSLFN